MKKLSAVLILLLCVSAFAQRRALTAEDMWALKRVSDPRISPDGKFVAYSLAAYSMAENKGNSDLWLIPVQGGAARQLTNFAGYDGHPRWSPDGSALAFLSSRSGSSQIFLLPMDGGEPRQIGQIPSGVDDFEWTKDGRFLFVSSVYPGKSLEETARIDEGKEKDQATGRKFDALLYRHWNHWRDGKRSHVFLMSSDGADVRELTPGDFDTPPISLGGDLDYALSPDGGSLYFVRNADPVVAVSTNNDIFRVSLAGGEPERVSEGRGNDNSPAFSPDGRHFAYLSMKREGFEADQPELLLTDLATGAATNLTADFDLDAGYPVFSPDGKHILFVSDRHGRSPIYRVSVEGGAVETLIEGGTNHSLRVGPGGEIVFVRESVDCPAEVFLADPEDRKSVV